MIQLVRFRYRIRLISDTSQSIPWKQWNSLIHVNNRAVVRVRLVSDTSQSIPWKQGNSLIHVNNRTVVRVVSDTSQSITCTQRNSRIVLIVLVCQPEEDSSSWLLVQLVFAATRLIQAHSVTLTLRWSRRLTGPQCM